MSESAPQPASVDQDVAKHDGLRRSAPDLALRTQVGVPDSLMTQVMEGVLDIAVIYAPQHRPGLKIELLFEEKLVLVTTGPDASRTGLNPETAVRSDYVYVDVASSRSAGPVTSGCAVCSRTLRKESSTECLARRSSPAYAVYGTNADETVLRTALEGLRAVAGEEQS